MGSVARQAPAHWPAEVASKGACQTDTYAREEFQPRPLPCPSGHLSLTDGQVSFRAAFDLALGASSRHLSPLQYFLSTHP